MLAKDKLSAADAVFSALGPTLSGVELLHEAVERYLKGYLISRRWRLVRTHNLIDLISAATDFDASFEIFVELAEELTEQFFLQHYPGNDLTDVGKNYSELRRQAQLLIERIEI